MSSNTPNFDKLTSNNYPTWAGEMEVWFRSAGLWCIVSGLSKCPTVSATTTPEQDAAIDTCNHVSYMKPSDTGSYLSRPFIQDRQLPVGLWPIPYPRVSWVLAVMDGNSKHM